MREKAGVTMMRHVQRYLAGALNEQAGEDFLLAMARATERGAKTPAEALGLICHEWLARQRRPAGARDEMPPEVDFHGAERGKYLAWYRRNQVTPDHPTTANGA